MHALGLLLIIAFIIFIVPIIGIFQLILRFFFGKKNSVKNPFGQQGQNNKGRTTWYTHTKKNKKVIQDDEGEYIDCLLYTSPSPRDRSLSRMPSSA